MWNCFLYKLCLGAVVLVCSLGLVQMEAQAQIISPKPIKPGKEQLILNLEKAEKWKKTRIKKDVPSIRSFTYHSEIHSSTANEVKHLETTTIDRRYYPIRARATMQDKIRMVQRDFPDARMEVVHEQLLPTRQSGIYVIYSDPSKKTARWIVQAIEGPTAFHEVEIELNERADERGLSIQSEWIERLKQTRVE